MKYLLKIIDSTLSLDEKLIHLELAIKSGKILSKKVLNNFQTKHPDFLHKKFTDKFESSSRFFRHKDTMFSLIIYSRNLTRNNSKIRYINQINEFLDSNIVVNWSDPKHKNKLSELLYISHIPTIIKLLNQIEDLSCFSSLYTDLGSLGSSMKLMKYLKKRRYKFSNRLLGLKCTYNYIKAGYTLTSKMLANFLSRLSLNFSEVNEINDKQIKYVLESCQDVKSITISCIDSLLLSRQYLYAEKELKRLRSKIIMKRNIDPNFYYPDYYSSTDLDLIYNKLNFNKSKLDEFFIKLIKKTCIEKENGKNIYRYQNLFFLSELIKNLDTISKEKVWEIFQKYRFSFSDIFLFIKILESFNKDKALISKLLIDSSDNDIEKVISIIGDINHENSKYGILKPIMIPHKISRISDILEGLKIIKTQYYYKGTTPNIYGLNTLYKDINIKVLEDSTEILSLFVYYGKDSNYVDKSRSYPYIIKLSKDDRSGVILFNEKGELLTLGEDFNITFKELASIYAC